MKKHAFLIPLTLVYMSCPPAVIYQQNTGSSDETYKEYPITIDVPDGDISRGVEVFEAEVSVYRMNNRTDTALRLDKTYNLIIQEAGGQRITRIDYTDDCPIEYRSIIFNNDSIVLFNPETEEINQKIDINQPENPAYRLLSSQNYLSKINLSLIRQEAKRIALDIETDNTNTLTLAIPPELAQLTHGERRMSTKIAFDVKDEVLASTETVTMTAGGTLVTITVTPRYEMVNGVPIKTGQTTVTKTDVPQTAEVPYEGVIYNDPDDIPTMSREEYESLMRQGLLYEKTGLVFGDPNDLSYIETEVELYNTVKVNHAPAMAYRLPSWLKAIVTIVYPPAGVALIIADALVDTTITSPSVPILPPAPDGDRGQEGDPIKKEFPSEKLDGEVLLAKVSSENIGNMHYYYFDGFDFNDYKASPYGITDIIQDEYQAIRRGGKYINKDSGKQLEVNESNGDYVIVGHSEGGLRALAYATYLKKHDENEYKNLKGVITISGANKGFKALEGGIPVFKYKVYSMIDVLANGIIALDVLNIAPSITYLYRGNFSSASVANYTLNNPVVNFFLHFMPDPVSNYIVPVLSTNNYDTVAEIRDMVPFSRFANTYVADIDVKVKSYVVGTVIALELSPYPHFVAKNVYKYYTVYTNEIIQFDETLAVAYINGTDNNFVGMIEDYLGSDVIKTIIVLAAGFEFAENIYSGINQASHGLSDLFTDTLRSRHNARRAKEMFMNFNGAMHDLLGSPNNDSLLAVESMHYQSGNVLGVEEIKKRHNNIMKYIEEEKKETKNEMDETRVAVKKYLGKLLGENQ